MTEDDKPSHSKENDFADRSIGGQMIKLTVTQKFFQERHTTYHPNWPADVCMSM